MKAQSGIVNHTAQNLSFHTSSASSTKQIYNNIYNTPISKIPTVDSTLSAKSDDIVKVFYENVNGLSTNRASWQFSYKFRTLRQLWRVLDPNLIAITEIQINSALLNSSYNIPELLFQSDLYVARLSNNSRELIGKH